MRASGTALLALCAALALAASPRRRADMSAAPFVLGSRYGRAPGPQLGPQLGPRNDRFFMSGRYGKRSGWSTAARVTSPPRVTSPLLCHYCAALTLFRCLPAPRQHQHQYPPPLPLAYTEHYAIRRNSEERVPDDE